MTSTEPITALDIEPVTPAIGALVRGVDLRRLDESGAATLRRNLLAHGVLFFRDQELTWDEHLDLGRLFGDLHVHPAVGSPEGYPELLRIHADEHSKGAAGTAWHSDVSCEPEPPMGSILHLSTVPPVGGDTLFSSMYAAYEALSDRMKAHLRGLVAEHRSDHVYSRGGYLSESEGKRYPSARHPVVRTHPETGRNALFVNSGFTTRIAGLPAAEGAALLRYLFEHVNQPLFQCRFRWEPNSVAFWDNRCVQHYAMFDYHPHVRSGWRVTIAGDAPFFDPGADGS